MATFIATGTRGLEAPIAEELRELGVVPAEAPAGRASGAVCFEGPPFPSVEAADLLRHLNRWARGVDRFGVLLAEGGQDGLDACCRLAGDVPYGALIDAGATFAVRARREGEHEFGSMDLAARVGEAVIERYKADTGKRLAVSLRDPGVIVRAEVDGAFMRLWLDATGDEPLYRRDYRRQLHPASLRATVAHLLLRVAGWRGEPLLDPMTGIGTIPIEAGLYAHGIAPGSFRRGARAADLWSGELVGSPRSQPPPPRSRPGARPLLGPDALDVLGIERYEGHLQGALLNLAGAGNPVGIRFERGDARSLQQRIEAGRYRLAVVNPPFGRRVGSTGIVAELYRRFAGSARESGVERVVALAESRRLMGEALEAAGYAVVRSFGLIYGDLPAHVLVADVGGKRGDPRETG